MIRGDAKSSALFDAFTQIYGVGEKTAAVLLSSLPEAGTLPRGKISSLAGVAPFDSQSGGHVGARHCRDGRKRVRCALYMATLVAVRAKNSPLRSSRGTSPAKKALVACMRKLLIHINSTGFTKRLESASPLGYRGEATSSSLSNADEFFADAYSQQRILRGFLWREDTLVFLCVSTSFFFTQRTQRNGGTEVFLRGKWRLVAFK